MLFSNLGYAFEPTFRGFFEAGSRTTIEAIDEEGNTLDYDYTKYYLRYKNPIRKPLNLTLVYSSYHKKYEDKKELNNNTISLKSYWDYSLFERKESSLKLDVDLGWREKRYRNKDLYTNSQWMSKLRSTYKIRDLWSVSGELGYKDYDYFLTEGRDRKEFSESVDGERYFFNKRLQCLALLNFRQTDFDSKPDTNQFIYRLGANVKPEFSFLSEMEGRIEEGKKYTDEEEEEEEEEQEGDYYFKYRRWWLKTKHPVFERMYTVLKYTDYNKNYTTAKYDHRWYEIENWWRYLLLENPTRRLSITFSYLHRETDYSQMKISSYDKDSVEMGVDYSWKNNWNTSLNLGVAIYDYTIGEEDKKNYSIGIQLEKEIIAHKLALATEYKWKFKDYELGSDKSQNAGRVSIDYKF
ncbi:hypothetical protein MUO65_08370 [bacterium]|nr:hypothetical protein [bacterium]